MLKIVFYKNKSKPIIVDLRVFNMIYLQFSLKNIKEWYSFCKQSCIGGFVKWY